VEWIVDFAGRRPRGSGGTRCTRQPALGFRTSCSTPALSSEERAESRAGLLTIRATSCSSEIGNQEKTARFVDQVPGESSS